MKVHDKFSVSNQREAIWKALQPTGKTKSFAYKYIDPKKLAFSENF